MILLALSNIVDAQSLRNVSVHTVRQGSSLVITGSYDRLSILLPGENDECNLEIDEASIVNLTIYVLEECNNSNIRIIDSNINYLVLLAEESVVESTIILNSTIMQSNLEWSNNLIVSGSKLGIARFSATSINMENSIFGDIIVDLAFELVVSNSTGHHLTADLGVGSSYTNLKINGLVMKCKDLGIPGYKEGAYGVEFAGPYSSITISSQGGEGQITNTTFACPEGHSFMSVNGLEYGYISGLVMNSTNSSFAWIGFNPGTLYIENSEIYGNITILLSAVKQITFYMSNVTVTYSYNTTLPSRLTIKNSTLGHISRRGNATKLPEISEMITAENIGLNNVLVNAMILNLFSANISLNNTRINVRSLTLYRPSNLIMYKSVVNAGFTTISAYTNANYIINNSIVNSNLIVRSSNGHLNLTIVNTAYQGDRVFATHLLNSTLTLNITNSRMDRASKISIIGYPPWRSQAYFYTSHSYFGSLLGPRIVLNGSETRPGGSTIEFVAVKAAYIVNSWNGDPGLNLVFKRASGQIYVSPLNGSLVPALMKTGDNYILVYLLELPGPSNKLYLQSNYEVNLSIMLNDAIIKTISGHGVIEVEIPMATDELIIIPNNIKPVKTVTTNTTTITNSTIPPTTTAIPSKKESTISTQILAAITLLITILIAMYILVRHRKS